MEPNSSWKRTVNRYSTFVRRSSRTGDLCVGPSHYNHIHSYYGPFEEKTTLEPIVQVRIPCRTRKMNQRCVKLCRYKYRIVKLGIFSPVTGFVTKGPAFVWEGANVTG